MVWVNDAGQNVGKPTPPSRADGEAIGVALFVWIAAAEGGAGFVSAVRRRPDRGRFAQRDREINGSHDNDDRRNHKS
ncbi:hypothetical protein GGC64_000472 [Mycobacterium sp. OAS707]|nr:hypothetical protein [Mycobacterium sp. OAS707]